MSTITILLFALGSIPCEAFLFVDQSEALSHWPLFGRKCVLYVGHNRKA